jgi:restriction endonuclease Mrr
MVDALPFGGKKKGADGGIDGIIYFKPDGKRTEKALVSVKGGGSVSVTMIRDLHSAMERERAPIGVFICAGLPTRGTKSGPSRPLFCRRRIASSAGLRAGHARRGGRRGNCTPFFPIAQPIPSRVANDVILADYSNGI